MLLVECFLDSLVFLTKAFDSVFHLQVLLPSLLVLWRQLGKLDGGAIWWRVSKS